MLRTFGLIGLVVALAIVAVLAKRQAQAPHAATQPLPAVPGAPASAPAGSVRDQSQQIQQQVRQQMDTLMQQARPMPDDESK